VVRHNVPTGVLHKFEKSDICSVTIFTFSIFLLQIPITASDVGIFMSYSYAVMFTGISSCANNHLPTYK